MLLFRFISDYLYRIVPGYDVFGLNNAIDHRQGWERHLNLKFKKQKALKNISKIPLIPNVDTGNSPVNGRTDRAQRPHT